MDIRLDTGEVITESQFRNSFAANISLPADLNDDNIDGLGAAIIHDLPAPVLTKYQRLVAAPLTQDGNGRWQRSWLAQDWSQSEINADKAAARTAKWEAIKIERSRRESGGVLVAGNWFHTDAESRIKIMGLVILGTNIPADQVWKTMAKDGNGNPIFVPMTRDLANSIFLAVAAHDKAVYAVAEQHRVAMEAAADPSTYDLSANWPAIYQG